MTLDGPATAEVAARREVEERTRTAVGAVDRRRENMAKIVVVIVVVVRWDKSGRKMGGDVGRGGSQKGRREEGWRAGALEALRLRKNSHFRSRSSSESRRAKRRSRSMQWYRECEEKVVRRAEKEYKAGHKSSQNRWRSRREAGLGSKRYGA